VTRHGRRRRAAAAAATRVYRDYLEPERLAELLRLLGRAVDHGYESMTLSAFAEHVAAGAPGPPARVLLLRHDVDSDVRRARRIWEIERGLGMVGTYFFRRSTWDVPFMRELAGAGCDVGYHYEELATLIKEHGAPTAAAARELIVPARERLRDALVELRAGSGLALDVLASHGDFANRAVNVPNVELLDDAEFRTQIGARLEAYDIEEHVNVRCSDGAGGGRWFPVDPDLGLARGARVVELLIHPRAWGAAPMTNARMDAARLLDGARYRLRRAARPLRPTTAR
jgi:hypothetical protein